MNKFKTGDKVRCINCSFGSIDLGDICVVRSTSLGGDIIFIDDYIGGYVASNFELVQEFDLKNNDWFIRTGSFEKSKAVQEWLFSLGITWLSETTTVKDYDEKFLLHDKEISGFFYDSANNKYIKNEIKITTKLVIDSITFPEIISEKDKIISELERTIEKAKEQLAELKESM